MITRQFDLFLNKGVAIAPTINVNQYDHNEQWVFTLYQENGSVYTPLNSAIAGVKSDKKGIINSASVNNDGQVVVVETEQMTAAAGTAIYELVIDDGTHGTANFIVQVEPKPTDGAELSDSDYSYIQDSIDEITEATEEVKEATEKVKSIVPTNIGTDGQVLTKTANGADWVDKYPSSGTTGQVLTKTATGEAWEDVDGLPVGGTAGQVLTKNSSTDGDASWQTQQSGGGTWGSITGTLSDQTDLQNALNAKANTNAIESEKTARENGDSALHSEIESVRSAVGSPLVASTAAEMTNTNKVYVYTGSETGYTAGDWYYYDGSAWVDGGVYNSVAFNTDKTLSVEGSAADAKKTGDKISDLKNELYEKIYEDWGAVTIQQIENASAFKLNNPSGMIRVDSTDKPIFTGTPNIIDLFGLAQGVFTDSSSGVTIEITGNEVYMHGSTSRGFRFDLQKGEFYQDSFNNHIGNINILPDYADGYDMCYWEKAGYTMPSDIYFGKLNGGGTSIAAVPLIGHVGTFYKNNSYFAFYSNGAIANIDVKFTVGLKIRGMSASVVTIEGTAKMDYGTTVIKAPGYYPLNSLTWTGDDTVCSAVKVIEKIQNLARGHKYAWFGDSISQLKELPNIVSELICAKVYDCTFAGAPLTYGDPTRYQPTGFMSLCNQIVASDFTPLSNALDAQEQAGTNVTEKRAHLATLQTLDFNEVTDIVLFAGTNDFDNDYVNATKFVDGFTNALTTLLTAYPHLMVYVISPIWRGDKTQGVATIPTMPDLVNLEKQVADAFCLPFYDFYHRSGINSLTASVYLTNDLLHPSDAGDALLANKCAKFIQSN